MRPASPFRGGAGRMLKWFCRMAASTSAQCAHPAQVQSRTHELPLCVDAMQPAQTELAEPEDALDPAIRRLGDPLASSVRVTPFIGFQLGGHCRGARVLGLVELTVLLALATQG